MLYLCLFNISQIIEQCDTRFQEEELQELVDLVVEVLPPLSNQPNAAEEVNEDVQGATERTDGEGIKGVNDEKADDDPMTDG